MSVVLMSYQTAPDQHGVIILILVTINNNDSSNNNIGNFNNNDTAYAVRFEIELTTLRFETEKIYIYIKKKN